MALFTETGDDYVRTGKGPLTRWANKLSFVPQFIKFETLAKIPIIGGTLTAVLGYADTILESAQWLFRGQFGSAATTLVAGAVGSTVNGLTGSVFWWANAASGVATGATLGTHARAATETAIGAVTGALGAKPLVLQSYTAGIGSIGGGQMQSGPGKFFTAAAHSKGESNADAAYARMAAGNADHIAALEAARAQGTSAYRSA